MDLDMEHKDWKAMTNNCIHVYLHDYIFLIKIVFVKQNGLTPLHLAAQDDRVGVTEVLLNHGADIDAQTKVSVQYLLCFYSLHKQTDAKKCRKTWFVDRTPCLYPFVEATPR